MFDGLFHKRWFERGVLAILAVTAIVLVALAMVDQRIQAAGAERAAAAYKGPAVGTSPESKITFAVVGDSVTASNSADIDSGDVGDGSWAYYANGGQAELVGGWALGGTTTATMAQNVKHYDADVLVILAGTNDTGGGVPFSESTKNLESVVKRVGIKKVIVSSIPPRDDDPAVAVAYNTDLRALAAKQGWVFVDAMAKIRGSDNRYKSGYTSDGVHPTPAAAKLIGAAVLPIILDTAS